MKRQITFLILALAALLSATALRAQVNIGGEPVSYGYEGRDLEPVVFVQTPPLDMAVVEAEDAQWEAERAAGMTKIGRRFGIEFEVEYDVHNSGTWTCLPDGGKLWRLGVECPEALSINLIFDRYRLPSGATLYIYSEDKHDKIGGFTDYNNQADNFFATDVVLSDRIVIEYYQPVDADFDGELRLATIVHGYRGPGEFTRSLGQSGACQINTICPLGEGWEDQIRSVFALYSGGSELCSGAIVNNTANDGTPYALTANHCWNAAQNTGAWVFRFNWESPTCTPTANSDYQTMSGAVLRMKTPSSSSSSDCCLVELNQVIPENYNVYYAGWSRSTTPSSYGMGIHHPNLDIKKISKTASALYTYSYSGGLTWRTNWTVGGACTEPGSSGSPLFDDNHRIVGQLWGGGSYCGAPSQYMYDAYGRFDISWNYGSSSATRLRDWLDPLNLNPTTWDGQYQAQSTTYTISATAGANGTINPSGNVTVNAGASQTFTFTPASSCYEINQVLVDGTNNPGAVSSGSYTFNNVTSSHTISVSFKIKTYAITASAGANGSISPNGNVTVNCGANQTFTFTPASACYEIDQVLVNGVNNPTAVTSGSYTFNNVTGSHTISVSFKIKTYAITASAGANGSISPNGNVTVNCGTNQTFTFTPASACYEIDQVLVDGTNNPAAVTSGSYTFNNVTGSHTISVSFKIKTYAITASAGANGSISPDGNVTVDCDANQTFTFTPEANYEVDLVKVDNVNVSFSNNQYTFTNVTADHTINVTFKQLPPEQYTITPTADANGTISPDTPVIVNHGDNQTFTFIPDMDYEIDQVKVDGMEVDFSDNQYTFINITADHAIHVTFKQLPPDQYTITVVPNDPAWGSVQGGGVYIAGATADVLATPTANYLFVRWTENGMEVSANPLYTFIVEEDRYLVAWFEHANSVGEVDANAAQLYYFNEAIYFKNVPSGTIVQITDVLGRVIHQAVLTGENIPFFLKGVFAVKLIYSDKTVITGKIVTY